MNNTLGRVAGFSVLLATCLSIGWFRATSGHAHQTMLAAVPQKLRQAAELPSPKILLVGGSNVGFSFDTERLEKHFQCPAYNLGVHAGLGLKFMLDTTLPLVQPGDTVVVIPEYEQFGETFLGERALVRVLLEVDPSLRDHLSVKQKIHLFPNFASVLAEKATETSLVSTASDAGGIYARDSFNHRGDEILHLDQPPRGFESLSSLDGSTAADPAVIAYLQTFYDRVRTRGATLILLPPCLESQSFANRESFILSIQQSLYEAGIPFIAAPMRYRFDRKLFFDTPYHLDRMGIAERTTKVIEDIQRALNVDR